MDIREYFQTKQKGFYAVFCKTLTTAKRKLLFDVINEWHEEKLKNLNTSAFVGNGVRVRFVLCDFDNEDIWCIMPSRVNDGDSFYIDDFVTIDDEKRLKESTLDYLYDDGSILDCDRTIFGKDEQGIYQQVYLIERK